MRLWSSMQLVDIAEINNNYFYNAIWTDFVKSR